ncbi:MAG: hypothetical protein JRJ76_17535 [Deltaproteobacteria bacterium]|nr:hypothetical protein [Deltaproteobacteria bacterium]
MKLKLILLSLVLSFSANSQAIEFDPFTRRNVYEKTLADFTGILKQKTNQLLDLAVADFNENCQSDLSLKEIHRRLAFTVFKHLAARYKVEQEPQIPNHLDFHQALEKIPLGPLEKWIVNTDSFKNKYVQPIEDSVYTGMLPLDYSTSYIIRIKGLFVGPDKIDHFLDEGYSYWIVSNYGENDQTAVDWGVRTENGWFGREIDSIFSFADLQANWMGYQFYKGLLSGSAPLFSIDKKGCVKRIRDFDWSRWIDWRFDELQNPCAYDDDRWYQKGRTHIREYLEENLEGHRYCLTYQYVKNKGYFSKPKPQPSKNKGYFSKPKPQPSDVYLNYKIPTRFKNIFDIKYLCE